MQRFVGLGITFLIGLLIVLPAVVVIYFKAEIGESIPEVKEELFIKGDLTSDIKVKLYKHDNKKIEEIALDQYLIGVIAAEMPAAFHIEALKAQAVAARTYTVRKISLSREKGNEIHPGADICTDFSHNQAWIDKEEMKKRWGSDFVSYYNKIREAVVLTEGQILVYNSALIDPVYHADCGGVKTENSQDVWQANLPYLQSVECLPREDKAKTKEKVSVALRQVDKNLGTSLEVVPVSKLKKDKSLIKIMEKTKTGRVKTIKLGDKKLEGKEVRSSLGLRSTNFSVELQGDKLYFTTIGNGHGVGLCQVGSNEWAKKGLTYDQILLHYYQGVKIDILDKK